MIRGSTFSRVAFLMFFGCLFFFVIVGAWSLEAPFYHPCWLYFWSVGFLIKPPKVLNRLSISEVCPLVREVFLELLLVGAFWWRVFTPIARVFCSQVCSKLDVWKIKSVENNTSKRNTSETDLGAACIRKIDTWIKTRPGVTSGIVADIELSLN